MGLLMYKDIPYGGGGSDIEPNPSGSATEDLTKLGIDDTNYNVADADYRSDQKTYTFKVYDTNTHKYGSSSVSSTTTIRGVISAISALFDSVKTAINDHADVFTTINTAISSINTALRGKADTTNATYTKLTGSGHRFGDIDISQSAPFTSSDVSTIENANMAKIKTIVNNLADYAEENAGSISALGTAAQKDVPTSGNASSSQVVMGNDTRLTDARNAADVYSWAKAATKPSYTASEVGALPTTGGTMTGNITMSNNTKINPATNADVDLGEDDHKFSALYANSVVANLNLSNSNNIVWDDWTSRSARPSVTLSNDNDTIPTGAAIFGKIQNNASATDLDNNKLPTGQTIKSYLSSKILIEEVTINTTISANDTSNIYSAPFKTGYRLLGCNMEYVTVTSTNIALYLPVRIYQQNNYRVVMHNFSSSANTIKGSLHLLYIKQ